jgi:hypothetical protein
MKKIVLLFLAMMGLSVAHADNSYTYLTFETTDGARISVPATQLKMTIRGNTLSTGTQTFTLANLSKMYFTATDETTTGISTATATIDEATEVYDLNGRRIDNRNLPKGVYIVKTKDRTYKMTVK